MIVRAPSDEDFAAIQRIYADAVLNSASSFEIEAPAIDELRRRHARLVDGGYPYLVAELDDEVAGYCYAGPFRDRPAYRQTVESSVYVGQPFRRQGVARTLLIELIEQCRSRGFQQMVAVIGGTGNDASIGLHEKAGFNPVGVLKCVGRKFDSWHDVTLMQRSIASDDPGAR